MIELNHRDPHPIYQQVYDQLRRLMVTGILAPDEKLPSVRSLAMQLSINPNTMQRAYTQLERDGYIYSIPGKGSFVSDDMTAHIQRKEELLRQFHQVVGELHQMGVTDDQLLQHLKGGTAL